MRIENRDSDIQYSFVKRSYSEKIAYHCHNISAHLASPCWWYSEKAIRIFSSFSHLSEENSVAQEIFTRIFYGIIAIPMVGVSMGLSVVEAFSRILANSIQPNPFFYLEGDSDGKFKRENSFSVLTMNICAVGGGFPRLFAGVGPWKIRIKEIIAKLINKSSDVICLQEVNDVNAAIALYNGLKSEYRYFYINVGSRTFTQNSGHFVASKYPVEEAAFLSFSSGKGLQHMVNKGLFSFSLRNEDGVFANIFTTHLSPSKDDYSPTEKEQEIRHNELEMIMSIIEKTDKKYPETNKVLMGDMNLRFGSDEWENSCFRDRFYDPYNDDREEIPLNEATCGTDEMIRAYHRGEKKGWYKSDPLIVDYALVYDKENLDREKVASKLVRSFDFDENPYYALSDHNGLLIEVPV